MLEIANVVVRYQGNAAPVLNGFSLRLAAGERVALIGPSGAGKTTLFRAISGFLPLEAGTITVDGASVAAAHGRELREVRRKVAVISQGHDLVDRLRVYQNVLAGALGRWSATHALRFLLWPKRRELDEARAALARVGIPDKLKARTTELSGGQHQRVAIARALVQQPSLMLADEPIASLDPALSEQILTLLCGLAKESGIALLCSLHQHQYAIKHFDRVVELAGVTRTVVSQ
jgi:phosphonate transport system ATP-binding protein